jgi:hypothetical protein
MVSGSSKTDACRGRRSGMADAARGLAFDLRASNVALPADVPAVDQGSCGSPSPSPSGSGRRALRSLPGDHDPAGTDVAASQERRPTACACPRGGAWGGRRSSLPTVRRRRTSETVEAPGIELRHGRFWNVAASHRKRTNTLENRGIRTRLDVTGGRGRQRKGTPVCPPGVPRTSGIALRPRRLAPSHQVEHEPAHVSL